MGTKFKVKAKTYDISDGRLKVWHTPQGWRGMIVHSDGSDGVSNELVGATDEKSARQLLIRWAHDWLLDEDATAEELGLT